METPPNCVYPHSFFNYLCVCVCVSPHSGYDPYVHILISFSLAVSSFLPYGENFVTELPNGKKVNKDDNSIIHASCEYLSVHNVIGRSRIRNGGHGTLWDKE